MRALRIVQFGSPADLQLTEVPDPAPEAGDAVVAVHAAAINPVDVGNLAGKVGEAVGRSGAEVPRTGGRDYAGVVTTGPAEWVGSEVWGSAGGLGVTRDGTHAEYVVVPVRTLSRKPAQLSMTQASSVGVGYGVAWVSLLERARLRPGETVVIVGAAGAVGRAATQLAHWSGAYVIGVDRHAVDDPEADDTIDTTLEDQVAGVLQRTAGRGADVVFDVVGGPVFQSSLRSLAARGRQVAISSAAQPEVSFSLLEFYRNQWTLHGVNTLELSLDDAARGLNAMRPGFESGMLRPPHIRSYTLDDYRAAYEAVQAGTRGDKVVLTPTS